VIGILRPVATTNLIENPSLGLDTTGYIASGSSIARSLDRARFGRASLKITPDGLALNEGAYYSIDPNDSKAQYTGSVYVRGAGTVRIRLRDQTNGLEWVGKPVTIDDDYWRRLSVTGVLGANTCSDLRLYVETAGRIQSGVFYADGFQTEQGSLTSYTDGDLELEVALHDGAPFFWWEGGRYSSISHRSRRYRPAGELVDLSQGLDVNLWPTAISGLGMPPIRLRTQTYPNNDRAEVQSVMPQPRAVMMTFTAVGSNRELKPVSLRALNRARRALEDVVKADMTQMPQPFILRYAEDYLAMDLEAFYEAGLEFQGDIRYPIENRFGARFFCPNPFWQADSQDVHELTASQSIVTSNYGLLARVNGEWQEIVDVNGAINVVAVHPNGDIYIGGAFTSVGGVANTARVARYDGENWHALANGIDDGEVNAIAFAADGTVYIGGSFTAISATTYNRIASYDPSTDAFSQMGTEATKGLDNVVRGLAVADDLTLYIAGDFTATAGGGTTLNYVASYTPGTNAFGALSNGLNAAAYCVIVDMDGSTVYFGGNFTDESGGPGTYNLERIAKWTGSAWAEMSEEGMDATVRCFARGADGRIYAGGAFTQAGFWDADGVAVWSRREWYPLGKDGDGVAGGGATVYGLVEDDKGLLWIAGDFTSVTNASLADYLATWDKTRLRHTDAQFPAALHSIAAKGEDIYVALSGSGTTTAAYVEDVESNGRAASGPLLDILGPAHLVWLENQETDAALILDLEVQDGERVLIDMRPGMMKAISDARGNVMNGISPGSNFGDLRLLPGDNRIAFLATGTTGDSELCIRWRPAHWSFDDL